MFRLLLIFSLLTGCVSFNTPFKPEFDRGPNVKIKYVYVDHQWQMNLLCRNKETGILGCADIPVSSDGVCVVTLFRNGPAETREHEEKHCRYGAWHN